MPSKPEGYKRKGRPTYKDVKNLKIAKALLSTNNSKDAYKQALGSKCTDLSAKKNFSRILSDEVIEDVRRLLALDQLAATNRENLEKLFYTVITMYFQKDKRVKTGDMLRALENLKELVNDFKKNVHVDQTPISEEEAKKQIEEEFGIDPSKLGRFNDTFNPPSPN